MILSNLLQHQGIKNKRILSVMDKINRAAFVPKDLQAHANDDQALPIGFDQTISQPYIVARMTELLLDNYEPSNILEVGTGSGYQAAVLAELIKTVYTLERIEALYKQTKERLFNLGYKHIALQYSDGKSGWPEHAPFDAIIITAATKEIPPRLLSQLKVGGRMILPLTESMSSQRLCVIDKEDEDNYHQRFFDSVIFVPLLSGYKPMSD